MRVSSLTGPGVKPVGDHTKTALTRVGTEGFHVSARRQTPPWSWMGAAGGVGRALGRWPGLTSQWGHRCICRGGAGEGRTMLQSRWLKWVPPSFHSPPLGFKFQSHRRPNFRARLHFPPPFSSPRPESSLCRRRWGI